MGQTLRQIDFLTGLVADPKHHRLAALFSCRSDVWATPRAVVDEWAKRVGPFALDVAASSDNACAPRFYTESDDGLRQSWSVDAGGEFIWCNPPYSATNAWVAKAIREHATGAHVVMLLPSRTDTRWFHSLLNEPGCSLHFLRRRLTFGCAKHPAPFPSLIVVLK